MRSEIHSRCCKRSLSLLISLIDRLLQVFAQVSQQLLPTPLKSHYMFNLRDASRVFQGLQMVPPASASADAGPAHTPVAQHLRAVVHEILRVFYDCLVDDDDRNWLISVLNRKLVAQWPDLSLETLLSHLTGDASKQIGVDDVRCAHSPLHENSPIGASVNCPSLC